MTRSVRAVANNRSGNTATPRSWTVCRVETGDSVTPARDSVSAGEPLWLASRPWAGAIAPAQWTDGEPLRLTERDLEGSNAPDKRSVGDELRNVEVALAGDSVTATPAAVSTAPLAKGTVRVAPPRSRSTLALRPRPISGDPIGGL